MAKRFPMVQKLTTPTRIPVPGGKLIEEYAGRASTGTEGMSIAHMVAPARWAEPFQQPAFDEVTIVLRGTVRVEYGEGEHVDVGGGEVVLVPAGERIRYSNPTDVEAEYWAICAPAFSPDTVNRDPDTALADAGEANLTD